MSDKANRFLLISRVGPQSVHENWLKPAEARGFDVLLSSYDRTLRDPGIPGVKFEYRAGRKVAGYAAVLKDYVDHIAAYDYVALFDDDLVIDAAGLDRLFDITAAYNLKIAQPALSHNSYFTYAALLQHRAFKLRYVNYIEMMCPIFRVDVLQTVRPLFDMGYESGIDLIWCNLVAKSPIDFAVIDEVTVQHIRPVGALKADNGFGAGKRYEDDIYAILDYFRLPWLSCVPFAGVQRNGVATANRVRFIASALRLAGAVRTTGEWRMRARSVAVYWKHLATRKAKNIPVKLMSGGSEVPSQ